MFRLRLTTIFRFNKTEDDFNSILLRQEHVPHVPQIKSDDFS